MSARLHTVSNDARPAVEVRGLGKTYPGGVEAVRGIDFQVAPGEVFGLLGPNGAGKSTTIGMLTTTIKPTSGSAWLAGFDVARHPIAARSVSSVVFQESVLDKALTGRRNLDLHARLWGIPPSAAASKITELAGVFGLSEVIGRPVDSYSGGQRRRLEIARALATRPRLLLLDEPAAGMNPIETHEITELIGRLREERGVAVLVIEHDMHVVAGVSDRVVALDHGVKIAEGSFDAVAGHPAVVEAYMGRHPEELAEEN